MSDKVLIAVPGLGVLALEPETYRRALTEGAQLAGVTGAPAPTDEPLLDAEQLAEVLHLPRTRIESAARDGSIPSVRCGRWRRFRRSAVERALANGKGGTA
jgi:excisionase family DNA binding protein